MANTQNHTEEVYDLIVIGSGPAGIHAAVQAAKLKKKVCIIEKMHKQLGGALVHTGTLPSKTLRESFAAVQSIKMHVGELWVERIIRDLHTGKLFHRASMVSTQEEELIRTHLQNNDIKIFHGYGSIENRFSVRVIPGEGAPFTLNGNTIMIATGSRPRRAVNIPFDGWRVVDSDELLRLDQMPKSVIIFGAGVVGCEYACIFKAIGVEVTIVDTRSRILQFLDSEVGLELQRSMESMGVKFLLGTNLGEVRCEGPSVQCKVGNDILRADLLFYAAGRIPCTEHMGLERLGIVVDSKGAIIVNENFQTIVSNIYAAGDAIGSPALAATSSHQGRHVACHAFGVQINPFPSQFPVGVYTIPELSMIGKTEEELRAAGIDYVVGRASYNEIARGYIRGDSHGLLKLLVDVHTHRILGIHIVGDDACNLIHIGQALMLQKGIVSDFINRMIFNYPTLAEGYRIAAFNALNKIFPDGIIKLPQEEEKKAS